MAILNGPSRKPIEGETADSLVVLLHGIGANGEDLIGLADALGSHFPRTAFHSPDAPNPYAEGGFGFQWFPREPPDAREEGVAETGRVVRAYVEELLDGYGLDVGRCVLIGFSQGCMTALYAAPRMERQLAGVVGFSGALLLPDRLADEARSKPPFVLVHGEQDPIVPPQATADAGQRLAEAGFAVEAHLLPGLGHSIDQRGLQVAAGFMERVLGAEA